MTTDLRQWLEAMAAEAAAARDAEPPREWSNGWHDGNRAAYHAVLTWLGDHPTTADRDRLRETMASALHATAPRNHPPAPMLRSICIGSEPHMDQARQIVDILAALAQPPAPAATAETLLVGGGPYRRGDSPASISRRLPDGMVAYLVAVPESVVATMGDILPVAAARAEPLDVEALETLRKRMSDAAMEEGSPLVVAGRMLAHLDAFIAEARRRG